MLAYILWDIHTQHIYCIVPGGGVGFKCKWKNKKTVGKYIFPVRNEQVVSRKIYRYAQANTSQTRPSLLISIEPDAVPQGLGRVLQTSFHRCSWGHWISPPIHTHKIAISNHRIQKISPDSVIIKFAKRIYKNKTLWNSFWSSKIIAISSVQETTTHQLGRILEEKTVAALQMQIL